MCVADTLVALPALPALLLLAGACAQCEQGPRMTATGPTVRNCGAYCADYGQNIELFCTFRDSGNLTIQRRQLSTHTPKDLPTLVVNTTTIFCLIKPTLGHYTYLCVDKSGCESSLFIDHKPAVRVASPHVHLQVDGFGYHYFLPVGDDFQVICAGSQYKKLDIYNTTSKVSTNKINDRSVAFKGRADRAGKFNYECRAQNDAFQRIWIRVYYFPETFNFSCISYDFGDNVICSWNSSSMQTSIKLLYKNVLLPCVGAGGGSSCVWNNMFSGRRTVGIDDQKVSIIIQACIHFFCRNQTFAFIFDSIMKFKPVRTIIVSRTSSKDTLIMWPVNVEESVYKIEYRLAAVIDNQWSQVNTSSIRCDDGYCQYILALPYPDSLYEVRVFNRHAAATDDRVWSDPTSVSFVTKHTDELSCKAGATKTAEPITPFEASCEASELTEYMIKKSKALRNSQRKMRLKRGKFNKKLEIIKRMDDINSLIAEFNSV